MKLLVSIWVLYPFVSIIMMAMQQPWTQHDGKVEIKTEVKKKDLIVKTNKQVYEYGEPVEVEVSRNFSDIENNQQYGKYTARNCGLEVSKINDSSFPDLDCSNEYSCKYYCSKFRFLIESVETKRLVWDQEACFGTSWYGDPVSSGDYVVGINCDTNLSSNKVNIKIKKPPLISCGNKKGLKINKVTYSPNNNVVMEIENNSAVDIESVGIEKICLRTAITDSMKDTVSEGLRVGEKKEYFFDHKCTKLNKFRAYPYECLSDRDFVYYEYNAWFDDM